MTKKEKQYIVTEEQILWAIRSALEEDFSKVAIVELLMKNIEDNLTTVLEDDCDEMTDEMWEMMMV